MSKIVNVNGVSIRVVDGAARPYRTATSAFTTIEAALASVQKFISSCAADRINQSTQVSEMMAKQRAQK